MFFAFGIARNTELTIDLPSRTEFYQFPFLPRANMAWRRVVDINGKSLDIYGQSSSSSRTDGHDTTIEAMAVLMAKTGTYARIYMQRAWRTATGKVNDSRSIPDLLLLRHDGKVDAIEVMSETDSGPVLQSRLAEGMEMMPPEVRGDSAVVRPGSTTNPFGP